MGCWRLFGMTGTDLRSAILLHLLSIPNENRWLHIFQEERSAWADKGLGGRNVCNPRQWETWTHSLALWTVLPFQLGLKGLWLGLTSGHLHEKSCIFSTLSFAQFLLLLYVSAENVNTELYYWAIYELYFSRVMFSCSCIWSRTSGCGSLLEKVASFFSTLPSTFKLQSWGTLADSAF